MFMSRSDIKAQTAAIAAGLPDTQRIALGLELIRTVESADRWTEVRQAGVEALRHSELLSLDRVRQVPRSGIEINPPATTHEQFDGGFKAGPRATGRKRAASFWEWIKRSNDTLLGDFIGGLALIVMLVIGLFAVGVYDGTM